METTTIPNCNNCGKILKPLIPPIILEDNSVIEWQCNPCEGEKIDIGNCVYASHESNTIDNNNSWLDHHVLNEDSEINGIIIKHPHSFDTYGGVSVKTDIGNFAIIKDDQEEAFKNKGKSVRVKPHKDYYATMMILNYN